MDPARIAALLQPFLGPANDQWLTPDDLNHISTYIDILLRWNARINLTAIRDPEDIVPRHFGESLFAARHLFPRSSSVSPVSGACPDAGRVVNDFDSANDRRPKTADRPTVADDQRPTTDDRLLVADLGSGAGFPGLPLKLWTPEISLTLIESNQKKVAFLREVVRALTLTNVNIQNARAESLSGITFDLVTLRAVESFESILPTAASLVAPAGRLALLISSAQTALAQSTLPTLSWSNPIPIPQSRNRVLVVAQTTD
jgi:16S rRNA (guanine527-N7)-methyltransferase